MRPGSNSDVLTNSECLFSTSLSANMKLELPLSLHSSHFHSCCFAIQVITVQSPLKSKERLLLISMDSGSGPPKPASACGQQKGRNKDLASRSILSILDKCNTPEDAEKKPKVPHILLRNPCWTFPLVLQLIEEILWDKRLFLHCTCPVTCPLYILRQARHILTAELEMFCPFF